MHPTWCHQNKPEDFYTQKLNKVQKNYTTMKPSLSCQNLKKNFSQLALCQNLYSYRSQKHHASTNHHSFVATTGPSPSHTPRNQYPQIYFVNELDSTSIICHYNSLSQDCFKIIFDTEMLLPLVNWWVGPFLHDSKPVCGWQFLEFLELHFVGDFMFSPTRQASHTKIYAGLAFVYSNPACSFCMQGCHGWWGH